MYYGIINKETGTLFSEIYISKKRAINEAAIRNNNHYKRPYKAIELEIIKKGEV